MSNFSSLYDSLPGRTVTAGSTTENPINSSFFSKANRSLPNGGGSYSSTVPNQSVFTPAGTTSGQDNAGGNTGAGDNGGTKYTPTNSGVVTPEDYAYAANALTKAMGSQGDAATVSGQLTGLNNTANDLSVGAGNLFPSQTDGTAFSPDELTAMNKAQGNVYAPGISALTTKLGQAEESDVYSNKFQGPLTANSFSPDELTALNNVAAGKSEFAGTPAYISATAKIQEANKRGLDSQRFGYTQSLYNGGKTNTANLTPVSAPIGSAAYKGGGADGSVANSNFGQPAYYDANGAPLDANGNPWPTTGNTYGNVVAQQKLASDYVDSLQKAASSRSGDLGVQNSKVSSAIHAQSLIDQATDPKTGNINLSSQQYQELASSVANLLSGGNAGTDSQINGLLAGTLQGTVNNVISYISGDPQNATTQANLKRLVQTVERQGATAEQLRDAALQNQAIVPAGMDPARAKQAREQANFPSYTTYLSSSGKTAARNPYSPASSSGSSSTGGGGLYDF